MIRERIAVEKTVAEQEEEHQAPARRRRRPSGTGRRVIIPAEAEAQERLVKDIKAAEAAEQAAQHRAREDSWCWPRPGSRRPSSTPGADPAGRGRPGRRPPPRAWPRRRSGAGRRGSEKVGLAEAAVGAAGSEAAGVGPSGGRGRGPAQRRPRSAEGRPRGGASTAKALAEAAGIGEKLKARPPAQREGRVDGRPGRRHPRARGVPPAAAGRQGGPAGRAGRAAADRRGAGHVLAAGLEGADIDIVGGDSVFFDRLVGAVILRQGRRRLRRELAT